MDVLIPEFELAGVKVTEQLPVVLSVQFVGMSRPLLSKLPPAPLVIEKVTVPVGVMLVPAGAVSLTVAMHIVAWLTITVVGAQVTAVMVVLAFTVTIVCPLLTL